MNESTKESVKEFFTLEYKYFSSMMIIIIVGVIIGGISIPSIYEHNTNTEKNILLAKKAEEIKAQEANRVIAKVYQDTIIVNGQPQETKITVSYIKGSNELDVKYE